MRNCTIPASVLATVLVVCMLMLLVVLSVMSLWYIELTLKYQSEQRERYRAHIESAFVLYALDSTLTERLREDRTYLLYEGDSSSRVQYTSGKWGLYEVVTVKVRNGTRGTRMFGKRREGKYGTTLFLPEDGRTLSLAGKTYVKGDARIPRNGIVYTQVRSVFFGGEKVDAGSIKQSPEEFPFPEKEYVDGIRELFSLDGYPLLAGNEYLHRSFTDSLLCFETGEYLSGVDMRGRVILYTPGELFLERDNRLENLIVVARKVEIAAGFQGSLQVFARDSILLEDEVRLSPGSGLWGSGENDRRLIRLGKYCEVNGYIIVSGHDEESEVPSANYFQSKSSRVRGLVYVDGIAEVHGVVSGSLYARSSYYFAPEGFYSGILYDVALLETSLVSYPFWMGKNYERKEVKWVD